VLVAALSVVGALLAWAGPALAGSTQESIFQDDRLLTHSTPEEQAAALDKLAYLGVDTIHTVVNWRFFAPQPGSRTMPPGFDGSSSRSYVVTNWDVYDSLVRGAAARGIKVFMSPAGPVPNWASGCKRNVNYACKPNAKLYGDFVRALATRYSGTWVDEDQDQTPLPRVSLWGVWNEPNLGAWLYPQSKRVKHGRKKVRVGVGAAYYRRLVYAAGDALNATGHGGDRLLIGETAPLGSGPTRTEPGPFLRQLLCVDGRGRVLRGRASREQGCRHARRMKANGLSHHPYARGAGVPLGRKQRPGAITIGTIGRMLAISRATARSPVMRKRLPVYITEFGVTTRPPDRKFGVSLSRQAQYLNVVDYLAFRRPWIKSVSQFQLEDDTGLADRGTFQTGLMFGGGGVKPSFQAYRIPIFVVKNKKRITVFGQVRPARGTAPTIEIQSKRPGKDWQTVATRKTNSRGYVLARFRARKGSWRIRWVEPNGTISFSRGSQAVPPSTPSTPGVPPPGPGTPPPPPPPGPSPETPPPTGPAPGEPPPPPPAAQYTLTVTLQFTDNALLSNPSGRVTSSPAGIDCSGTDPCRKSYTDGTKVTLTAQPGPNTAFAGFTGGGCSGTATTCTVTMSQARSVTASFSSTGL
jgi:hypothetical protein